MLLFATTLLLLSFILLKVFFKFRSTEHCKTKSASILIVVGSGGHTREILTLATALGKHYTPRYYIIAETDKMSKDKICKSEQPIHGKETMHNDFEVFSIPRSREVKQSYFSSVLTTINAMIYSLPLVFKLKPEIILCNGPGTCIPLCIAGLLLKLLSIKNTYIVYVESFCRVKTMSLSGKLLYPFIDSFFVQWPDLLVDYPKAKYVGRLV